MSETIGQALARVAGELAGAGIDEARIEARRLVGWAAGLDGAGLISQADTTLGEGASAALARGLAHRMARRPLAHLEGWTEFYGLRLKADPRALIPRSDSECVVELALENLPAGAPARIADLGTGSGCLLLALLAARPDATGEGIDESADAIALARENARALGPDRATWRAMGWRDWAHWAFCDLIISNPPYIRSGEIAALQPEVRDHEPRLALDGGPDGLAAYREIVALAGERMKPGAALVFEIGHDQREPVAALLESAGFANLAFRRDLAGRDRAISALRP